LTKINFTGFADLAAEVTAKQLMQRTMVKRRRMLRFMMARDDAERRNLQASKPNLVRGREATRLDDDLDDRGSK